MTARSGNRITVVELAEDAAHVFTQAASPASWSSISLAFGVLLEPARIQN
ncbi:MAG: hypothetical protein M3042_01550 [Actinomycetota bacterium]|nr:hypothetical protein [Actinomycetota bacterium]